MKEQDVFVCKWERSDDGFVLWVKSHPDLRATGTTYAESERQLIEIINAAGLAIVAVLEFVPPLPKGTAESKYSAPEIYAICGDDRFETDAPNGLPFETAEEQELRFRKVDEFFESPICRSCGFTKGARSDKPLLLRYVPKKYDGAFGHVAHEGRISLKIFSAEFLGLLTEEERNRLKFKETISKGRKRVFFELVGPGGAPMVAVKGLPINGWRCAECSNATWGYWCKELIRINHFVAKSDLPDPLPGVFTIGVPPIIDLCATAERWLQLAGRWGTRGFTSRSIGVVSDHEVIRSPELQTSEEMLAEARQARIGGNT